MAVSKAINFADKNLRGVQIEPKVKAHYGVIELLAYNKAAVIHVNAGQVIYVKSARPDYCIGFADGSNRGTGVLTPHLEIDLRQPLDELDCASMYAEWLEGQRRDASKNICDLGKWGL